MREKDKLMKSTVSNRTILYIEDNAANRQLIEMIIELRADLTLILAENGRTGLQEAERQLPNLILLDISLPDMDGYEVLAHLRKNAKTREIPVISLSGDPLMQTAEPGLPVFDGCLAKPIEIEKFYAAIDRHLQS